ncbi:MAG: ABC transporter ATP-binding protein [Anaerolineae bacterium]
MLEVSHISKTFDRAPAVDDVSLSVDEGEIVCLLGPSGCGKTTLLRLIAGLETADRGRVLFEGADIGPVPPHRREFGMMFQEFALFPHKNVFENVAFGLRTHGQPEQAIARRTQEMLSLVGLDGFERRDVNELSGGERQRVALARSLAPSPRLLMLDEPLGSLDRALRERLMLDLRQILKRVGVTAIYVTHDQLEAFAIADRIAILNRGRVEQVAPPEALYRRPATPFVAHFLGFHNLLEGKVIAPGRVETALGPLALATDEAKPGQSVKVLLRPEAAALLPDGAPPPPDTPVIRGTVIGCTFRGQTYRLSLQASSGATLVFEVANDTAPPRPGQAVSLTLHSSAIILMPPRG